MFNHESNHLHDLTCYGGMSSSSHPWATAAGTQMLMRGGNAVDAAIATAFALAVCEPAMSHLGGQGNMLVNMTGELGTVALDFYACAPGGATPDMFNWIESPTQGDYRFWTEGDRNTTGALSVCIPGNVCGWVNAHRRWGVLPLTSVVGPAVSYARDGTPLTQRMAAFIEESLSRLRQFPKTAAVFLHPDGSPKTEGEYIFQSDLADTLDLIAHEGDEVFYTGEIAQAIVSHVQSEGGILTLDDLAGYPEKLMWVRSPDRVPYKDFVVEGATPASSALLLHMLRLVDGLTLSRFAPLSTQKLHLLIEAMKLAFADRTHIADHTHVNLPLVGLLDKSYSEDRRQLIQEDKALFPKAGDPWAYQGKADSGTSTFYATEDPGPGGCTTHHSHVDRWGNFVSLTQSLGDAFGSAVTVPGYGFLLNNAMKLFDPRPGSRLSSIAAYKRPLAPWPTLLLKDEKPVMAIGSPSGTRIPNAITQVLVNVIDHRMGLQAAVNMPRVHWSGHELEAERDLPEAAQQGLKKLGHEVQYRNSWSPWFGAVQVVARDPGTGFCHGAADPRRQGAVAGVSLMPF